MKVILVKYAHIAEKEINIIVEIIHVLITINFIEMYGVRNILNKGMYYRIFTKGLINNSIKPNLMYL